MRRGRHTSYCIKSVSQILEGFEKRILSSTLMNEVWFHEMEVRERGRKERKKEWEERRMKQILLRVIRTPTR
jgi:hypothetical protein